MLRPPEDFLHRVAQRLAIARRERGVTQEGLAAKLDMATKNVQRMESGKQNLTLRSIERVALALDVEPEAIIGSHGSGHGTRPSDEGSALARLRAAGFVVRPATESGRRSRTSVPVWSLLAAAGKLGGSERAVEVLGWVDLPRAGTSPSGQFLAEVRGASMEPQIADRSICLFGRPGPGPLQGRVLLVEHGTLNDPDLGGPYALKRIGRVARLRDGRTRVVLRSANPANLPIVVDLDEGEELKVIAELVRVVEPRRKV
jgi:transcriptional regulator with XRE-family HTH domain